MSDKNEKKINLISGHNFNTKDLKGALPVGESCMPRRPPSFKQPQTNNQEKKSK